MKRNDHTQRVCFALFGPGFGTRSTLDPRAAALPTIIEKVMLGANKAPNMSDSITILVTVV